MARYWLHFYLDTEALPGENQVKSGASAPAIGNLMHNWSSGILLVHNR